MLVDEAKEIGKSIRLIQTHLERVTILNLGSSTANFRDFQQPYISKYIFSNIDSSLSRVIHVDLKNEAGVDLVADITKAEDLEILREYHADILVVSNLLEHVTNLEQTCSNLLSLMKENTVLILSGPKMFPFHPDPIDNGWRPGEEEIRLAFPELKVSNFCILKSANLQFAVIDQHVLLKVAKYITRLIRAIFSLEDSRVIKENFFSPVSAFFVELRLR